MPFRFTAEDFERYVKMDEHGGRHLWHDLQDGLQEEFGVPFSNAPYVARGDRLQTMWFAPKGTPRPKWDNQAQFYLARSIDKRTLSFGLVIECPTTSDVAQYGYDPDLDAARLVELLGKNADFVTQFEALTTDPRWSSGVSEWGKQEYTPADCAELLDLLKRFPPEQGWDAWVGRTLSAEEAIAAGDGIVNEIMEGYRAVHPLWKAVIPESVRTFLATGQVKETTPGYTAPPPPRNRQISIHDYFASRSLHFSPLTLAIYFTALQTKGFVILSGLSGTGKTRLAQHFAELMQGSSEEAENYLFLSVRPDWRDGRPLIGYHNPLTEQYETSELLRFIIDARQEQTAPRLAGLQDWLEARCEEDDVRGWLDSYRNLFNRLRGKSASQMTTGDLELVWQTKSNGIANVGQARPLKVSEEQLRSVTAIIQDTEHTRGQRLIDSIQYIRGIPGNVTPWARTLRALTTFDPVSTIADQGILRRVVDWLGYEHPFRLDRFVDRNDAEGIDQAFAFLEAQVDRFYPSSDPLLQALTPWLIWRYLSGEPSPVASNPFFVLLDEVNISRVEYYFADFLSVLEGGRSSDGFTLETVKLHGFPDGARDEDGAPKPQDSDGRYVPPELSLPPNLYFVGTVNVDETTHAFSPKVLDRAFTIEITDVDFERYPATSDVALSETEQAQLHEDLLPVFTRDGGFGIIDKQEVRTFVASHPQYRLHLHTLKELLQPYDLHFAYRVFDEVIAFCANAEVNRLWTDLGGLDTAFDCAVLMKVLPKFHGPRSKLEQPLRSTLAWTLSPTKAEGVRQQVEEQTKDADACLILRRQLDAYLSGGESSPFRYANTARKAVRMLQSLHTLGFGSFA